MSKSITITDGKLPYKAHTFLVLNHSRKTYHFSDNGYCYREDDKNGKEVTHPNEKFDVLMNDQAIEKNIPKGYKNDME